MSQADAADELETILIEENAALERCDPQAAVALLDRKLAAANALTAASVPLHQGLRLRALAASNRRLLQRAIDVQSQIVAIVVRAAQVAPGHARYGAAGRTVAGQGTPTVARQA